MIVDNFFIFLIGCEKRVIQSNLIVFAPWIVAEKRQYKQTPESSNNDNLDHIENELFFGFFLLFTFIFFNDQDFSQ